MDEKIRKAFLNIVRDPVAGDFTARQICVMTELLNAPQGRTVRDMAEAMSVTKPAITRATDKLSILGWVKRKEDPVDRRSVFLVLQPAGKKFLDSI